MNLRLICFAKDVLPNQTAWLSYIPRSAAVWRHHLRLRSEILLRSTSPVEQQEDPGHECNAGYKDLLKQGGVQAWDV